MANPEVITFFPITITGPLSHQEAEDVMFRQAGNKTNITCLTLGEDGNLTAKTENPHSLIQKDDISQLADLHATMQGAKKIIISFPTT